MNLLYVLTAYPPSTGGAQTHQHMLAQQLKHRHAVHVMSMWDANRTDWLLGTTLRAHRATVSSVVDGINVERIGLSIWEKFCLAPYVPIYYPLMDLALPPIAACLERHLYAAATQADLVHNVRIGREGLSYAAYQVARRRDIPFILTPLHHPRWVGWRYRAFLKLYTAADSVLALTASEKRTLVSLGVAEERITVTGMGPCLALQSDATRFTHDHQIDGPVVLFLGQHYSYKGYAQVLEAASLVWQKVPETHFVFVGPAIGNSERLFEGNVDKRIHRLGNVNMQTKTDALAACTLLCVPSTQESFGGVYTEAWSLGKPVIGCAIPAVSEVIDDGINGLLTAQEPSAIADHICWLLLNHTQAQAMGEAGRRKVEAHYTWQQIAKRTEDAYRTALGTVCTSFT